MKKHKLILLCCVTLGMFVGGLVCNSLFGVLVGALVGLFAYTCEVL
jgi:outer membrane lipoprotein-sorting protein